MSDVHGALTRYVRDEAGGLVASLTRQIGNFDLAEEAVQEAIVEAVRRWPDAGVPRQPGAWLRVAARRKALDFLRREGRRRDQIRLLEDSDAVQPESETPLLDDRLVLMFTCCHPSLSREAQVALTLRSLLGLTTAQLAKAFLVSEATMTKRIVRAKRKIVEAAIPFAIPSGAEAKRRLGEVLSSTYVMFNEGYLSAGPDQAQRAELASDAEWLASLLLQLLPDEPEVMGLLALIRLHQARRLSRFDAEGGLVILEDQDRLTWDREGIDDALDLVNRAMRLEQPGFYVLQAAIAGCHAIARTWRETDWGTIIGLYDQLISISDSPVARLNRAIAIRHRDGSEAALAVLEPIADRLDSYHLYHATRALMLRDLGRDSEAAQEDQRASRLTTNPAELQLLRRRARGTSGETPRLDIYG